MTLVEMYNELRARGLLEEPLEMRPLKNFTYQETLSTNETHTEFVLDGVQGETLSGGTNAKLGGSSGGDKSSSTE
jgi:hypothetical protein